MNALEVIVAAVLVLAFMVLIAIAMGWCEIAVSIRTPTLAKRLAAKSIDPERES